MYDLLADNQSGFKTGHSTQTALLEATNEWYQKHGQWPDKWCTFARPQKSFRHCSSPDPTTETSTLWNGYPCVEVV